MPPVNTGSRVPEKTVEHDTLDVLRAEIFGIGIRLSQIDIAVQLHHFIRFHKR